MNLGTEILGLRRNKTSTVAVLISGIERLAMARSETTRMTREFALTELGDAVLARVAVYAQEAYWGDNTPLSKARRATIPSRRGLRHTDVGQLYQRRLFA